MMDSPHFSALRIGSIEGSTDLRADAGSVLAMRPSMRVSLLPLQSCLPFPLGHGNALGERMRDEFGNPLRTFTHRMTFETMLDTGLTAPPAVYAFTPK